jgi:hypothetical protein
MMQTMDDLKERTKRFALDVVLCHAEYSGILDHQSAVDKAAKFIAKLSIVEEEADECMYWLELLSELTTGVSRSLRRLHKEANELTSIFVQSKKTARSRTHLPIGQLRTSNFATRT